MLLCVQIFLSSLISMLEIFKTFLFYIDKIPQKCVF